MPCHANLLQSFPLPPQQSQMLQPIYSEEIPLLGELSVTWQEKFLGNECGLSICETVKGLEMSFQVTEGFW